MGTATHQVELVCEPSGVPGSSVGRAIDSYRVCKRAIYWSWVRAPSRELSLFLPLGVFLWLIGWRAMLGALVVKACGRFAFWCLAWRDRSRGMQVSRRAACMQDTLLFIMCGCAVKGPALRATLGRRLLGTQSAARKAPDSLVGCSCGCYLCIPHARSGGSPACLPSRCTAPANSHAGCAHPEPRTGQERSHLGHRLPAAARVQPALTQDSCGRAFAQDICGRA